MPMFKLVIWMILHLLAFVVFSGPLYGQAITIGDTAVESAGDNGNGNLILAQEATLAQSATILSLSFYVSQASGSLILGVYDATGPSGHPGNLLAATNSFVPTTGWNSANVVTPVALAPANYWLAYLPSSGNLSFRKQNSSGSCVLAGRTFSSGMPAIFATSPSGCSPTTWSFYATLSTLVPPTMHYTLQYTLTGLDLLAIPVFIVSGGSVNGVPTPMPVFIGTKTYLAYLGQFATQADCQAYVPPGNPSFSITTVDPATGMTMDFLFTSGGNMTATNNGCVSVNFK